MTPAFRRLAGALALGAFVLIPQCLSAQSTPWRTGRWNPDSFGNQRVVLQVGSTPDASVRAIVAWRRRDGWATTRRWILTDSANHRINNALALSIGRDSIDLLFEPVAGRGTYYLYYLPYTGSVKSNYPRITYPVRDSVWAPAWGTTARQSAGTMPQATVEAFEAVDSMSQRWPMEVPAYASRVEQARRALPAGQAFGLYIFDRAHPLKMVHDLPEVGELGDGTSRVIGTAAHDEYYVFQVGVWAQQALDSVRATFDSVNGRGIHLAGSKVECLNTDGVNWMGKRFTIRVRIAKGDIAPLWCGVMIPRGAGTDTLSVRATVRVAGGQQVPVSFRIAVSNQTVPDHGDDDPWRLSRLRWLNSQLAADGPPTPPYTAVTPIDGGYHILGRDILLDNIGFPAQVRTFFSSDLALQKAPNALLVRPFELQVERADGTVRPWVGDGAHTTSATTARRSFRSHGKQNGLDIDVHTDLDFDGNLEYRVALVASHDMPVHDVRLVVPMVPQYAKYFMGMNRPGGYAPANYQWKWDVTHNQDAFWLGDPRAGLQVTFKDEHYVRPLNTNFYQQSPLVMPRSWSNDGRGFCTFASQPTAYTATCGSGARTLAAHDTLWYNFRVLVTPFHPVDTRTHFSTRYYHAYKPVDTIRAAGANLVNVHHGTAINPYLNYPFLRATEMKAYADSLHAAGMRFKIYYTVRELTNRAPEFWALRSLGTEIFSPGAGGGHSWLQEHVVDNYITGWVVPEMRDMTLVTNGISRWHNYYVEGMQWLTQHAGVDGIYLDDVAFDRTTMLRIRRILAAHGGPGERIDLHSATQFNKNDGFASSANLYLEHFPFIDRLWFGEGFNYDSPPDYWLVEMSGLPFGLMGEMLEGGGNAWRGMLFGMTNRLPWTGSDPRSLWKAWDAFGITTAKMRGWWNPDAPVHTSNAQVLATTYVRRDRSMIAIASWAQDTVKVALRINWKALGLNPAKVRITAPEIAGFQPARTFKIGDSISVAPGRGWLLRLDPFDARTGAR